VWSSPLQTLDQYSLWLNLLVHKILLDSTQTHQFSGHEWKHSRTHFFYTHAMMLLISFIKILPELRLHFLQLYILSDSTVKYMFSLWHRVKGFTLHLTQNRLFISLPFFCSQFLGLIPNQTKPNLIKKHSPGTQIYYNTQKLKPSLWAGNRTEPLVTECLGAQCYCKDLANQYSTVLLLQCKCNPNLPINQWHYFVTFCC